MRSEVPLLHTLGLVGALILAGATPAAVSAQAGSYTEAQADRGRVVYEESCSRCHGTDLNGRGGADPIGGRGVLRQWEAQGWTLDELFFIIRSNMPVGDAASLNNRQRLDVLAYILQQNGYPAGDEPLEADGERLRAVPVTVAASTTPAPPPFADYVEGDRTAPISRTPTAAELAAVDNDRDWLYHTGDYTGRRYSGLAQINKGNVAQLQVACLYQMPENSNFQTGPIVYDGTMYVTTLHETIALDAATCMPKWRHSWATQGDIWPTNRGVALASGRIVRGMSDGYLVALDAVTGDMLWARRVAEAARGETITMAPLIWEDLIIIGPAGSENAVKGWAAAFSVEDGEEVWRFNIIPEKGDPGYDTWDHSNDFPLGGGALWTAPSLDLETETVYIAATNPAPDLPAYLRGGINLYTNAVIALDARSGALKWYDQLVPSDDHDWDLTQVSPLFQTEIEGVRRNVMSTVGKDGLLRLIDRKNQERLWEQEVTTRENVDVPVTPAGVRACPGILGGVEWNGPAYSPGTNMLYTPAVDWCSTFYAADTVRYIPGTNYLGGMITFDREMGGWVTAIDASTGEVTWRHRSSRPVVAAVTATGGGLVFAGELSGRLLAMDATSGDILYEFMTGGSMGGGIVTYSVDGKQYVAAASGTPSRYWVDDHPGSPTVLVFSLPD